MNFTKRDVHQGEHVGDIIRSLRQEMQWDKRELALQSGVKQQYIEAFEEYRYNKLPGKIYAKNFLVRIARSLRVNESRLLAVFEREYDSFPFKKTFIPPTAVPMPAHWTPKRVRTMLVFVLLFFAVMYVVVELSGFFTPPDLIISSPQDNIHITGTEVVVEGLTDPEVMITINNAPIDVDDQGHFTAVVDLTSGVNRLTIEATKKFGQKTSETRNLLVTQE